MASFVIDKLNGKVSTIGTPIGATFTWLANPLILFSLFIFHYNKKAAFVISITSTLLILLFMAFDQVIDSEAGNYKKVTELKLGYWLWLLSSITVLIGSLLILIKMTSTKEAKKCL